MEGGAHRADVPTPGPSLGAGRGDTKKGGPLRSRPSSFDRLEPAKLT